MMKQIIISGAIILTATEVTHASCLTSAELQSYQNIAAKADEVKDKINDDPTASDSQKDKYRHNFRLQLDFLNSSLGRVQKIQVGALCNAQKRALNDSVAKMKNYITESKSNLSLD